MDQNNEFAKDLSVSIVKLVNIVLMTVPFAIVWYAFYADLLWVRFAMRGHWLVIALYLILYMIIGRMYDAFKISYFRIREMVYSQIITLIEVNFIMYIVEWLLIRRLPPFLPVLLVFSIQCIIAVLWSYLAKKWYFHAFPANKTIIIWDSRRGISDLIQEYNLKRKYKVVAAAPVDECLADLSMLDDADVVFLSGIRSHDRNIITKYCIANNIKAFLIPRIGDLIIAGSQRVHMFHLMMLKVERYKPQMHYRLIKRLGDIILSVIGIIVLSPVILVTAICIKAEDHGPVFYTQCRLTKDGKEFNIIKFRSMRVDAEKDGVARLSTGSNDDRVTKVGRVIRKVRIDEIPQLMNIIAGDMSIVGPRAERPEIAEQYCKELPEFDMRLQVKAGLTGYAQVYGKYNTTPYDKLLMDLMYIANAGVFEDIRVIFTTIKALFESSSTEGIEEGQKTAMDMKTDIEE